MIIDSKGRLFGKINIIDLAVILFIILIIAVGIKFLYFVEEFEPPVNPDEEIINTTLLVYNPKIDKNIYDNLPYEKRSENIIQTLRYHLNIADKNETPIYVLKNYSIIDEQYVRAFIKVPMNITRLQFKKLKFGQKHDYGVVIKWV